MIIEYEINGKTYIQKKLVLGQQKQMIGLFKKMPQGSFSNSEGLLNFIQDNITEFLSIVLVEKSDDYIKTLKNKNLKEFSELLEYSVDLDTSSKVVSDFFELNPIHSVLTELMKIFRGITKSISKMSAKIGSEEQLLPSVEETLPIETESSGDIASQNVGPSLNS